MRIMQQIQGRVIQLIIILVYIAIFGLLLSGKVVAKTDSLLSPVELPILYKVPGNVGMECKAYIKGRKFSYTRRARRITVECLDLMDDSHRIYKSKSGKIDLRFKLETRYLVYVSKEGYQTKLLAFSTMGVEPTATYQFDFDLTLEKSGKASYNENTPSIYVVYNPMHRLFLYRRFLSRSVSNR